MKNPGFLKTFLLPFCLLLAAVGFTVPVMAQSNNILGIVIQGTDLDEPSESSAFSNNPELNSLLDAYGAESYKIAYAVAKTEKAKNCFRIVLSNAGDDEYRKLGDNLVSMGYEEVLIEDFGDGIIQSCPEPNDPCVQGNDGHYLTNANVPCAWEITHGSPDIVVALVDQYLDYDHPDLQDKIVSIWNADMGCAAANHGFSMAGAIAAIVDNNYCAAGTGYDTKVAFYAAAKGWGCESSLITGIGPAVLQAYADGQKQISVSMRSLFLTQSMVKEIVESGVTIVHSTGGLTGHNAYGSLPGVIGVGQVNKDLDYVQYSAFGCCWDADVDIYAPCLNVCRLESGFTGNYCNSGSGNSSFGAAMTSGIVALMRSVNANLCPSEIENIIELSNQGLPANSSSWPQMTQGVIDAEAAVIMAQNYGKYKITTPTVWNSDRFVSELSIEPGGELTIVNANISMGDDASVIVKRNARLILDNSSMYNCAAPWSGIKVWGNTSKEQPGTYASLTDPDQCGIVVLRNNSKIEGAKTGIATRAPGLSWPEAEDYYGGLIDCSNSDFIDCRKGVEFMRYPLPSVQVNPGSYKNKSQFTDCRFEEVSGLVNGSEGVTIWDTEGIKFERCQFYNMDSDGIVIADAGASVVDANEFHDNNRGILAVGTYPYTLPLEIGRIGINPNDFSGNKIHIDATSTAPLGSHNITNNQFFGGEKGIYLEGPMKFNIEENSFNGLPTGITALNTGEMSEFKKNYVVCNAFDCHKGNYFAGQNKDVQFLSNTFIGNKSDIIVAENGTVKGEIRSYQGSAGSPAGNCFSTPIIYGDIETSGNTTSFRYLYRNESACDEEPNTPGNYVKQATPGTPKTCGTGIQNGFDIPPTHDDLVQIKTDIQTLASQASASPDNISFATNLLEAEEKKEKILLYLLKASIESGDFQSAESLIGEENTPAAARVLFGLKMKRGAYQEAKNLLSLMPTTDDQLEFKQVQLINIARLENGADYTLSAEDKNFLEMVANGQSFNRVYAQGILTVLEGQRFARETGTEERFTGKETNSQLEIRDYFEITPNPANTQLNVTLQNEPADGTVMYIFDQLGRMVYQQEMQQKITGIPVANLPEGNYHISIQWKNGTNQQKRVVIAH